MASAASAVPAPRRKPNKGRHTSSSSTSLSSSASINLFFAELKLLAAQTQPHAGTCSNFMEKGMPVSVDTSPEKFDEPSDEQIRLNDVFTKDCPWLDRLFIQRGPLHSEKTRTLRGSLGDVWAVASFCELMAAMNLEETGLTLRVTSKYLVNGGWEKPYSANHSGALRPARLLELQQKSMVQLLPSNLRDFTSTFKASSLLIDNFLKVLDTDTLKDGQGLLLTGVSILFGYNTSVNYSFHSDKAANPKQSDTDITCICMLGPGKSTFYVAGASDEAVFEKPGDFHAFPSSLYHRSGQATSLTVKLVFFFKVKWPGMKDEEGDEEEERHEMTKKTTKTTKTKKTTKKEGMSFSPIVESLPATSDYAEAKENNDEIQTSAERGDMRSDSGRAESSTTSSDDRPTFSPVSSVCRGSPGSPSSNGSAGSPSADVGTLLLLGTSFASNMHISSSSSSSGGGGGNNISNSGSSSSKHDPGKRK